MRNFMANFTAGCRRMSRGKNAKTMKRNVIVVNRELNQAGELTPSGS